MFLLKYVEEPGIYRIPITGDKEERIVDLNNVPPNGAYGLWMGLDPTDARCYFATKEPPISLP